MIKIKILNPDYGMTDEELRYREKKLAEVCSPDTVLSMDCVQKTKVYIDSQKDVALAGWELMEMAAQAEKDGYQALVLYCGSDPAIAAIRELVSIPVVGGGEAAFAYANTLGYSFSFLVSQASRIPEKRHFVSTLGYASERLKSVRAVSVSSETLKDRAKTTEVLLKEIMACVKEDGAEVIVMGCLSYLGYGPELTRLAGVPVIDPCYAPVLLAESLVKMGLCHSKVSYAFPPEPLIARK